MSSILRASGLSWLSELGPVFFGIGFLAPLIAQTLEAASVTPPWGLSPLQLGLGLGLAMGVVAKLRGRWL